MRDLLILCMFYHVLTCFNHCSSFLFCDFPSGCGSPFSWLQNLGPKQPNEETPSLKFACLVSGRDRNSKIIDRSFTMQSLTCTSQLQDFASGPYPSYPLFKLTTEASNPFQQKWGMAINFWFLLIGTCALRTHAKMVQEKSPRRLLWWASWLPEIILAVEKVIPKKFNMYRVLLTDTWIYVFNLYINNHKHIVSIWYTVYISVYFYWHMFDLFTSICMNLYRDRSKEIWLA